ncbi:MAG: hypothetical protein IT428_07430 [Planctomycetaceae bacterium]|nr:hypothetical protein [Planctomycetaceae bacterium]
MAWFGVRSVYHFGRKVDGTNLFEERIVCFEAGSAEAALEKAAVESRRYVSDSDRSVHPEWEAYEQDGEPLIDGYEVFSQVFESRQSLADFYASRYSAYEYHPDVHGSNEGRPGD